MSQDWRGEGFDIFGGDVQSPLQKSSGFAGDHDLLTSPWAGAPLDPWPDPFGCTRLFGAQRSDQIEHELLDVVGQWYDPDDTLVLADFSPGDHRFDFSGEGTGGSIDDIPFLISGGVIDQGLKEESIALGLGKGVGPFLFDWVLCGQNKEGLGELVRFTTDGNRMFLHGFEQRGLCLWGGTIDFVRQQDLGEDGAFDKGELSGPVFGLLDEFGPGDIGGHEVGSELDAMELQIHGLGQRSNHEGFGQPWNAFEQAMAPGEHGDQQLLDGSILADDDLGDLLPDLGERSLQILGASDLIDGGWSGGLHGERICREERFAVKREPDIPRDCRKSAVVARWNAWQ